MLRRLLQEPRARGLPVDGVACTLAHREILKDKPLTRAVHERFYRECRESDERCFGATAGARWELGSGAGFLGDVYPDVVTSDVKPLPFVKVTASGDALPVGDGSLRAVYLVNVFHHVPDPRAFFREMGRAIADGGGLVMIEPYHGPFARLLFPRLHASEGYDVRAASWEAPPDAGPMTKANQALSYVIFVRDRERFEAEFPEWEVVSSTPHSHLAFVLSGGVNFRSLAPRWAVPLVLRLERMLRPLDRWLALQHTIVLRKRASVLRKRAGRATA